MTQREIENAIRRFERRIEEIKQLAASSARHDSVARRSAEENIQTAIRDTFGEHSQEYLSYYDYRIRF